LVGEANKKKKKKKKKTSSYRGLDARNMWMKKENGKKLKISKKETEGKKGDVWMSADVGNR
jgi:hypothetical protein